MRQITVLAAAAFVFLTAGCPTPAQRYSRLDDDWAEVLRVPYVDYGGAAPKAGSRLSRGDRRFNQGLDLLRRTYPLTEVEPYLAGLREAERAFSDAERLYSESLDQQEPYLNSAQSRLQRASHLRERSVYLRKSFE